MYCKCGDLAESRPHPQHATYAQPAAHFSSWVIITLSLVSTIPSAAIAESDFWPSGKQWREAALGAVTDPHTWIPAVGAASTGLTGLDNTTADWAVNHVPLFGSRESAVDWGDRLRMATHVGMLVTAVAVPDPWRQTLKRVLVEEAAVTATATLTAGLKATSDRQRPDLSDDDSFPSGYSSMAFAYATLGSMNIDDLALKEPVQVGFHLGLAAGTAWARVDGGVHFPSDVLFGAALGNFIGRFIQDAFLPERGNQHINFYFGADTAFLSLTFWVR